MINLPFTVRMDDGSTHNVVADDRDWARLEAEPFSDDPSMKVTRTRFLCWSVLTRRGAYTKPFDQFNLTDCVTIDVPDTDDEDDDEAHTPKFDLGREGTSEGS